MASSTSIKSLLQTTGLIYKFVIMLAAGALLVALATACFRFRSVDAGLERAEQGLAEGRLEEANALAARLEPWARCFPGRYRPCALVQVRCLARLKQPEAAARRAEALRTHVESAIPRGSLAEFKREPLVWLQKTSLHLTSGLMGSMFPTPQLHEWSGYVALLDELVASRDEQAVNALADDLIARFPRSHVAVLANAARGELRPDLPRLTAHATPPAATATEPVGTERAPSALQALLTEPETPVPVSSPIWGIVTNAAAMALNPETGQPIRPLKVGDVLAIEGNRTIDTRTLLTGTLILNNRNVPDLAFSGKDLEIRNGAFDSVSPEEVAMRSRLAEIQAEELALLPKLKRELSSLSPQEAAYRKAKAKMEAFQRDVDGLNAKLAKETGPDRMRTLDKLRLMKYQEQNLLRDVQASKEEAELISRKAGRTSVEPQLIALRQEKKAILKKLTGQTP